MCIFNEVLYGTTLNGFSLTDMFRDCGYIPFLFPLFFLVVFCFRDGVALFGLIFLFFSVVLFAKEDMYLPFSL